MIIKNINKRMTNYLTTTNVCSDKNRNYKNINNNSNNNK